MQVFKDINTLREFTFQQRNSGHTIGLVPTMGALHQGHLTLIDYCSRQSDVIICSIYVNPTQFNNPSDLTNYPRTLNEDLLALENTGCHAAFVPGDSSMYPQEPRTSVEFGALSMVLEGEHRPGHFNGVGLVVAKLFNIVQPDHAYFGQKDWQQVVIIKQLVQDLSFPIEIREVPIVRESDGLAMSSRNRRLTEQQRRLAPQLYLAISTVREHLQAGGSIEESAKKGSDQLQGFPEINVEYLEVVDAETLNTPRQPLGNRTLSVCIAARLGEIRLIDNVKVFSPEHV
ncbi:MAG: pantoate--beta-alanine ligase [Cyclobacteriaceae bacterium]|nr:pantoate--beta-alanine ligase [Cyclobacteriaceae bacterium]